jgi:hypothetical protein
MVSQRLKVVAANGCLCAQEIRRASRWANRDRSARRLTLHARKGLKMQERVERLIERPAPPPATSAEELRTDFEDQIVHASLLHFLRLGKHLDPFSNWMLAGSAAFLVFVIDKIGTSADLFGGVLSMAVVLLLVVSIAAGLFSRLMSLQGLVMAHQWENLPWEIERLRKEYRTIAGPAADSVDGRRVIKEVRTVLLVPATPAEYMGWIGRVMNRTIAFLSGGKPLDLSKVNAQWHGLAIAAHGAERVLPLVIAQTFFVILAMLCGLTGVVWHLL